MLSIDQMEHLLRSAYSDLEVAITREQIDTANEAIWQLQEDLYNHDLCPEHGTQEIRSRRMGAGSDPHQINTLACGHRVADLGDENVLIGTHHSRRAR